MRNPSRLALPLLTLALITGCGTQVPSNLNPDIEANALSGYINSGEVWKDTAGNTIEAHGGGMIKVGSKYYWIGEDKSHNSGLFKGVNCYSSTDLKNWTFEKAIFTPGAVTTSEIVERPKIVFNNTTNKYVMYFHHDSSNYGFAHVGIATSDTVCGTYTYVKSFRPLGHASRDMTLFKDDDGTGYLIASTDMNNPLRIFKLTSDYMDVAEEVISMDGSWINNRESPAIFKRNGKYYLMTSQTTGWGTNNNHYEYATSLAGPWTSPEYLAPTSTNTWDSQTTYVLTVQGTSGTTYLYMGDRWKGPNDLVRSTYVWQPLTFNGDIPSLDSDTPFAIDTATGANSKTLLKFDDYESWSAPNWTALSGSWSVQQPWGRSREYQQGNGYGAHITTTGQTTWKDYVIESYVYSDNQYGSIGLLGRVQNSTNFYQLELKRTGSGNTWNIYKNLNGNWTLLASGPFNFSAGTWYGLRFEMKGTALKAYVADWYGWNLLGGGTDSSFTQGKAGLRTDNQAGSFDLTKIYLKK